MARRPRRPLPPLLPLLPVAATVLALAGCGREAPPPAREFDGEAAFRYLEAQVAFGPRIPGSEGHRRTGDWLEAELRQRADTVLVQAWTHTTLDGKALPLRNFIARFQPAATRRILLLAHWDTRPRADGPASKDSTAPVLGANDGASGVAVLLGVADALKRQPPAVGVDLLFVDGEDYGIFDQKADVLIGSKYYSANPPPGAKPEFAVLFDMVGDRDLRIYQEGNSLVGAPEVVDRVWKVAAALGYAAQFPAEAKYTLVDDHVEIQRAGIPAIDVVDFDYPVWHTPGDVLAQVSAASLKVVGDVAVAVVRGVN